MIIIKVLYTYVIYIIILMIITIYYHTTLNIEHICVINV